MKKKVIAVALIIFSATNLLAGFLIVPRAVAAPNCDKDAEFLGIIPAWYAYLDVVAEEDVCVVKAPGGAVIEGISGLSKVLPYVAVAILDMLLRIAGLVAFVFIVLSGFRFVFAQGDTGKEKQARAAISNAVIGMVIAMLAAFIVGFIGKRLIS